MVRGAYHEQEQIAWRDIHGQESVTPVWDHKQETDQAYDTAVELLLSQLARPEAEAKIAVLFATHNEKSLDLILTGVKRHNLIEVDAKGLWTLRAPHSVAIAQLYGKSIPHTIAITQRILERKVANLNISTIYRYAG